MRRRSPNPYRRAPPQREPYDTVLIVCEGSKTELYYFKQLATDLRLTANVEVFSPGSDPVTVVNYAKQRLDEFERVFCVFDGDNPPRSKLATNIVQSSQPGRDGKWQVIVSAPCFEVWLLLHFAFVTRPFAAAGGKTIAENATQALIAELPNYKKGDPQTYPLVQSKTNTAIANAKRLHHHNVANNSNNPATQVHVVVDYLRKLKSGEKPRK